MDVPASWGQHRATVDGQYVIVHFIGGVDFPQWLLLRALFEQVVAQHGHVYMLAYVDQATTIAPEARRAFIQWFRQHGGPLWGVANIRASLPARVLGILLANALRILGGVQMHITFVEDEPAARKWAAEIGQKRQGRAGT